MILSIASAVTAAEAFRAGPAESYAHQSADQVTVGAQAFDRSELTEPVFGKKADLLKHGVLPVLVVIDNKRKDALDLRNLEVSLVASDGRHATAVSPDELYHLGGPTRQPGMKAPIPLPKRKNPMEAPQIVEHAFVAEMIPPGDSASGFFYFEARSETGDQLYINGIRQARSGQELLYFEFPLAK